MGIDTVTRGGQAKPVGLLDLAALLLLAVLGGVSFLFIRLATAEIKPFVLMDIRVLVAGTVLVVAAKIAGKAVPIRGYWRRYLILGALYGAIPYALIAMASLHISASMAAVLNATTALFTAVVSAIWLGDALSSKKIVGLLLGLGGVCLAVGWIPLSVNGSLSPWTLLSLLASLFYALGSIYAKSALQGVPSIAVAVGQQFGAGVLLLPGAIYYWPRSMPSGGAITAVLLLALLATALSSWLFFSLVAKIGPTKTLSVTFLVPVFGIFFGHLFLAEPITFPLLIGLSVILAGVYLVMDLAAGRQLWKRRTGAIDQTPAALRGD
jgi:drug/metabolite transporter (DMT)-like permease